VAEQKTVLLSAIRLSLQNPRLESIPDSSRDALKAMVKKEGDRLIEMAKHIVEHGLNPAELPILMPDPDNSGMFIVLEGNRRMSALKLLENPALGSDALTAAQAKRFRKLSERFDEHPITSVVTVVMASEDEAVPFLRLRHMGQMGGAGLVTWNAADVQRFEARRGKPSIELQILDRLEHGKHITAEERRDFRKEGITTLRRLIGTPEVREQLGLDVDRAKGRLSFLYPDDEVYKGLKRIVSDIAKRKQSSRSLGSQPQRVKYVRGLPAADRPNPATALPAPRERPPVSAGDPPASDGATPAARRHVNRDRAHVAPGQPKLNITHHRLKRIYGELHDLKPGTLPNASAALLRVFVELSLDHFIHEHRIPTKGPDGRDLSLKKKAIAVATELKTLQIVNAKQAGAIINTVSQEYGSGSAEGLHTWLHEMSHNPKPKDIILTWDNLQLLLEKIWP